MRAHPGVGVGRVALVDMFPPQSLASLKDKVLPDIRVYALSPASVQVLDGIGVWERILHARPDIGMAKDMQVWEAVSDSHITFAGSETDPLNYVVEHDLLLAALNDRVSELAGDSAGTGMSGSNGTTINVLSPGSIGPKGFNIPDTAHEWVQCHIEQKADQQPTIEAHCRLIVGADGSNSQIRSLAGLGSWGWEYRDAAIVATVQTDEESPNTTAWQRFLPTGPVALLPLHGGYTSIVWSTTKIEAERIKKLNDEQFADELNFALHSVQNDTNGSGSGVVAAIDSVFRGIGSAVSNMIPSDAPGAAFRTPPTVTSVCSPRFSFPLRFNQASHYYRPRVALLGDAAHTVHPLAGQGLNLGIADAKVCECV